MNIKQLTPTLTLISSNKVLDKSTGGIYPLQSSAIQTQLSGYLTNNFLNAKDIDQNVDIVHSVDIQNFNLYLKTSDGYAPSKNGFLVEVFLSGSDGSLTKMYSKDVVDPISQDTTSTGFENYFSLILDK